MAIFLLGHLPESRQTQFALLLQLVAVAPGAAIIMLQLVLLH